MSFIAFFVGIAIGFVIGILVYRNNVLKLQDIENELTSQNAELKKHWREDVVFYENCVADLKTALETATKPEQKIAEEPQPPEVKPKRVRKKKVE
jgi:uncharacterized membrane-anchored protein YhcB (DUF1043 family)